ncbi:multidrug effflux MFS transporter [Rhodococcoides kyotonense]|uniref:MFS transporter, DHA1 family, bicyclomycin/chloramphenicol resistance protein n=1 Tax=Rhodococcoides kyotonense TaxID=398843 RepID=A0A239DZH5_9NOCA|nr:multidrug effflux MFS transporter [Rhodococcus kyotonensis]SNS37767.1 MFS transporter, DHA1 family, bicyclomycin/chloramphenicol resistance protein [Rhodococcus kyotonensis]
MIISPRMSSARAVVVLGALSWLGPFSLDAYTPAFPEMAADYAVPDASIQLTLTALLVGLIVGQLVAGPVIDSFGRRNPVLIAVVAYCLCSAACAIAPGVESLMVARVGQGLTAAVALVAARAVGRDLFEGKALARFYSHMAAVTTVAPLVGPVVGAVIVDWSTWRAIFWLITGLGVGCLAVAVVFLPETGGVSMARAAAETPGTSYLAGYRSVLSDAWFRACALTLACVSGVGLTYLAGASFVFQDGYGLSATAFSLVFAGNAFVLMLGTQVSSALIGRFASSSITRVGLAAQSTVAIWCAAALLLNFPVLVIGLSFAALVFFHGLLMPNLTTLAMTVDPAHAGSASALVGVAQFAVGAVTAPLLGLLGSGISVAMAVILPSLALAALLSFFTLARTAQYSRHTIDVIPQTAHGDIDTSHERG